MSQVKTVTASANRKAREITNVSESIAQILTSPPLNLNRGKGATPLLIKSPPQNLATSKAAMALNGGINQNGNYTRRVVRISKKGNGKARTE